MFCDMKTGILTFHNIPNIGAVLQAFALCSSIRKEGVECEIIDYHCENIIKRELTCPKVGNILKDIIIRMLVWPLIRRKINACQYFMKRYNMCSMKQYDAFNISDANNEYDAFISGSDMIWNLEVTNYDWTYFCSFVKNGKKCFSYGSSIGGVWKETDISRVKKELGKYSSIAVRETDTSKALEQIGVNNCFVCDPTMLLSCND